MIKKILVSQPKPASDKSPYYDIAKEHNIEMVFRPFFKVEGITTKEFKQQKINLLNYTAVVFTSRHAIDNYFKLAKEMRITIPEDMKYFCLIETIALYIQKYVQYRKRKVFFGTSGKIEGLIPLMQKHKQERYLVPQSSVHNDDIKNLLDAKKLKHDECVMYSTVSNDFSETEKKIEIISSYLPEQMSVEELKKEENTLKKEVDEKKKFDYDMVVFFSPTGVKALKQNFPDFKQGDIKIAAFGPATAKEVEAQGLRIDLVAPSKEHPSMTAALKNYLENQP